MWLSFRSTPGPLITRSRITSCRISVYFLLITTTLNTGLVQGMCLPQSTASTPDTHPRVPSPSESSNLRSVELQKKRASTSDGAQPGTCFFPSHSSEAAALTFLRPFKVATGLQIALLLIYTRGVKAILSPFSSPYTGCVFTLSDLSWSRSVPTLFFEGRECIVDRLMQSGTVADFRVPSCPSAVVMILMVAKFYEYGRLGRSTELSSVLFRDGTFELL